MKKILFLLICFCVSSAAKAQFKEVFQPLIEKINGIAIWYSVGLQTEGTADGRKSEESKYIDRYGFSIGFGPLYFHKKGKYIDTLSFDSVVTYKSTVAANQGTIIRDSVIEKKTVFIEKNEFSTEFNLHFGYQSCNGHRYSENGLSFHAGLQSYFITGVLYLSETFGVGVSGSFYSMENATATYKSPSQTETLSLKVKTGTVFVPELIAAFKPTNGVFIDLCYQFANFSNPEYSNNGSDSAKFQSVNSLLPTSLSMSAIYLKVGLTFKLSSILHH